MVCEEQPCQFSPPFGDVTVIVGIAIVKLTLLISKIEGVAASLTFTRHCVEGVFGTFHVYVPLLATEATIFVHVVPLSVEYSIFTLLPVNVVLLHVIL